MIRPFDYQQAAIEHLWNHLQAGGGDTLLVLPTGSGKSLVIAWAIQRLLQHYPRLNITVLASRKELIKGNYEALMSVMPTAPAGIYSAGLRRKDTGAQVTFAGIASIVRRAKLFAKTDILIIDEAHEVSDEKEANYQTFINSVRVTSPYLQVIGLTATDFRMGMGKLTEGKLFKSVCFDMSSGDAFVWMIENGYLTRPIPKQMQTTVDTSGVSVQKGEFVTSRLDAALDEQGIIDRALDEAVAVAADYARWLVFTTSIDKTEEVAEKLRARGITAEAVHSKMTDSERDAKIAAHGRGEFQALVNKDLLTTGYNDKRIDCIVMLRPTKSPGLWVQMLGRGTRALYAPGYDISDRDQRLAAVEAGGKRHCLVLDFAGNTLELGPINYPQIPKRKGKGGGEPPAKVCPECKTICHISARFCDECGHEFVFETKLSTRAGSEELVAKRRPVEEPRIEAVFTVDRMMATRHQKIGRPDSIRVDYYCGVRRFTAWLGPEHRGPLRSKTNHWWYLHAPSATAKLPDTTDKLLALFPTMRKPSHIKVWVNTKYPEVLDYDFTGRGFAAPAGGDHGAGA